MFQVIKPRYLRAIGGNEMDKGFVTVVEQKILENLPLQEMGPPCWKVTFAMEIKVNCLCDYVQTTSNIFISPASGSAEAEEVTLSC